MQPCCKFLHKHVVGLYLDSEHHRPSSSLAMFYHAGACVAAAIDRSHDHPGTASNCVVARPPSVRRRNNSVRVVDASLTTASSDTASVEGLAPTVWLKTGRFGTQF